MTACSANVPKKEGAAGRKNEANVNRRVECDGTTFRATGNDPAGDGPIVSAILRRMNPAETHTNSHSRNAESSLC